MLKGCPNLTSVNFSGCEKIEGNIQVLEKCPNLTDVNFGLCEKIEGEDTGTCTSNELS